MRLSRAANQLNALLKGGRANELSYGPEMRRNFIGSSGGGSSEQADGGERDEDAGGELLMDIEVEKEQPPITAAAARHPAKKQASSKAPKASLDFFHGQQEQQHQVPPSSPRRHDQLQQVAAADGHKRKATAAGGSPRKARIRNDNKRPKLDQQELADPLHEQADSVATEQQQQARLSCEVEQAAVSSPSGSLESSTSSSSNTENICAACLKPIKERYLLVALDKQWHEDCLKCACCDCRLGEVGSSLFTHSDKILCRRDFLRIFGQHGRCAACKKSIPPYEMVMRANQNAYHMECFACQQCQYRFCVGDRFHLTEAHKIVCILCHTDQQQQQQSNSHLQHHHHHLQSPYHLRGPAPGRPDGQPDTALPVAADSSPTQLYPAPGGQFSAENSPPPQQQVAAASSTAEHPEDQIPILAFGGGGAGSDQSKAQQHAMKLQQQQQSRQPHQQQQACAM